MALDEWILVEWSDFVEMPCENPFMFKLDLI